MAKIPKEVQTRAKIELARRNLFDYCNLKAPDFYKPNRQYLKDLCNELQAFYFDPDARVMIVSAPPRHGKSRTAGCFEEWAFGQNPKEKIITGSYNETLSITFSKQVRNTISEIKADPDRVVYSEIFPGVAIKRGDSAMNLWTLEGQHSSYLATSPSGTATGFGATLMVIDDLIKSAEEALNENNLEKQWSWFTDTMLSRLEEGGKILIIMTRWASGDLAGRATEYFDEQGIKVRTLTLKAVQDDGSMLCPEILSYESYKLKADAMSEEIASANYQQEPIDLKGRLYSVFKEYDDIPRDDKGQSLLQGIYAYVDTADTGNDYLAGGVFGKHGSYAYMLDVIYTKESMEITEPETAKMLKDNEVNLARIESNNGGRAFARNVRRILEDEFHSYRTDVTWFTQSKNKAARILSNSAWIMEHVLWPHGWRYKWPELYKALTKYQKEGKNAHNDGPDMLTGVAETMYLLE